MFRIKILFLILVTLINVSSKALLGQDVLIHEHSEATFSNTADNPVSTNSESHNVDTEISYGKADEIKVFSVSVIPAEQHEFVVATITRETNASNERYDAAPAKSDTPTVPTKSDDILGLNEIQPKATTSWDEPNKMGITTLVINTTARTLIPKTTVSLEIHAEERTNSELSEGTKKNVTEGKPVKTVSDILNELKDQDISAEAQDNEAGPDSVKIEEITPRNKEKSEIKMDSVDIGHPPEKTVSDEVKDIPKIDSEAVEVKETPNKKYDMNDKISEELSMEVLDRREPNDVTDETSERLSDSTTKNEENFGNHAANKGTVRAKTRSRTKPKHLSTSRTLDVVEAEVEDLGIVTKTVLVKPASTTTTTTTITTPTRTTVPTTMAPNLIAEIEIEEMTTWEKLFAGLKCSQRDCRDALRPTDEVYKLIILPSVTRRAREDVSSNPP